MKKVNKYKVVFSFFLFITCLSACEEYTEEDIMSDISVSFLLPTDIKPERLHLEMIFTNINNKLQFKNNNIMAETISQRVVKGIYIILVEGVVVFNEKGVEKSLRLRGYVENVKLLKDRDVFKMKLIVLNI